MRKYILPIKAVVVVLLIFFIEKNVNIENIYTQISKIKVCLFLFATTLVLVQFFLAAARWSVVTNAIGFRLPFRDAVVGYLGAAFFSLALPSTIGGDAFRVLLSTRHSPNVGQATVGVVIDRAFGLLTLALLSLYGATRLWSIPAAKTTGIAVALTAAALIAGALVAGLLSAFFPRLLTWRLGQPLYWLSDGFVRAAKTRRSAGLIFLYSLAGHMLTVLAFMWLAASLGFELNLQDAMTILPVILLSAAIPLSINGWGIRESVSILVMGHLGYGADEALAVSLLFGLSLLLVGFFGGLVWLSDTKKPAKSRNG